MDRVFAQRERYRDASSFVQYLLEFLVENKE